MTTLSDHSSKQLYIPDYSVWDTYYQRKAKPFSSVPVTKQKDNFMQNTDDKVNLKFVTPVSETLSQAQSEIKNNDSGVSPMTPSSQRPRRKKSKKAKTFKETKTDKVLDIQRKLAISKQNRGKKKTNFSRQRLDDIFSKRK